MEYLFSKSKKKDQHIMYLNQESNCIEIFTFWWYIFKITVQCGFAYNENVKFIYED